MVASSVNRLNSCRSSLPSEYTEKLDRSLHRSMPPPSSRESRILIAGGGFGALFLALLLERLSIPYYLFEGGLQVKRLGGALGLGPNILPLFEQLGVASLVASISMPCPAVDLYDQNLKKLGVLPMNALTETTGYEKLVCARSNLYELILAQLSKDNIIMNKKVLSYEENEFGVTVCCSDNSIYCGDILVGADGTQSRIRHNMYKILTRKNLLPKADREKAPPNFVCVAGVAQHLSSEKYNCLKDPYVHVRTVVGAKGQGWHAVNIPDDQICWALWIELDPATAANAKVTEASEFGFQNTEPVVKCFREVPCPFGGTMGELVDATEDNMKARAFVEEKVYETWFHGRTVLLGDACHTMHPWSAQGETNEILDAVILANSLFELRDLSLRSITYAFKDYYAQRYPYVKSQAAFSRAVTKLFCGQSIRERFTRYVTFNWFPQSYSCRMIEGQGHYRPQASFMPLAEHRGKGPAPRQRYPKPFSEEEVARRITSVWGRRRNL